MSKICERCGKEFEKPLGEYATSRFCSRSCANTRKYNDEKRKQVYDKVSRTLKARAVREGKTKNKNKTPRCSKSCRGKYQDLI